mmetsp:Transcript_17016/g.18928  ORF Transcript_17016/g.18928 Transcript_17016/m.18928 type:complete len:92 (-) Transcript_17016:137-412(-)
MNSQSVATVVVFSPREANARRSFGVPAQLEDTPIDSSFIVIMLKAQNNGLITSSIGNNKNRQKTFPSRNVLLLIIFDLVIELFREHFNIQI